MIYGLLYTYLPFFPLVLEIRASVTHDQHNIDHCSRRHFCISIVGNLKTNRKKNPKFNFLVKFIFRKNFFQSKSFFGFRWFKI